jgi:hypothetical protein
MRTAMQKQHNGAAVLCTLQCSSNMAAFSCCAHNNATTAWQCCTAVHTTVQQQHGNAVIRHAVHTAVLQQHGKVMMLCTPQRSISKQKHSSAAMLCT